MNIGAPMPGAGARTTRAVRQPELAIAGTRTFEWNARNQLVAVNAGVHRTELTYDGKQRRVRVLERDDTIVQSDVKRFRATH